MKKLLSFIVAVCMIIVSAPISASAVGVCSQYSGDNSEDQNYKTYATPIKSYLSECGEDRIMKVQAGNNISGVLVEYYNKSYELLESRLLPAELPLFGGFYESDTNYFLLTGQKNTEQLSTTEVYRITKYDKNWSRISAVGLYDVNTTIPFDAGSARMVMCDDMLIIHTAHEMYTARDGYNHQSNITIGVDTSAMKVVNCASKATNTSKGYVSHSFNQFIQLEGKNIVTVDHGDAQPRSVVLIKHAGDASNGEFGSASVVKNIIEFPGTSGDNYTGASVGGFEISSSAYLVAGNTVTFDEGYKNNKTRNIFITASTASETKTRYITSYDEGETTTNTPHLVKIGTDKYMLMWSRENVVYYTAIDANGNQTGSIYSMQGNLSDCVPVVIDNKLVWYTWKNAKNTFYEINLSSFSENSSTVVDTCHTYEYVSSAGTGVSNVKCSNCGETGTVSVPTSIKKMWWRTSETQAGYYYSIIPNNLKIKDTLEFMLQYSPVTSNTNNEFDVIISNPSILSYEYQDAYSGYVLGKLNLLNIGMSTVTFKHKYNPTLTATYTINVKTNVTAVNLNKNAINLTTGGTFTLKPTFTPAQAVPDCKWSSNNTMIAVVDNTGTVTAKNPGTAKIHLTVDNTITVECSVTVTDVTLNKESLTLKAGTTDKSLVATFESGGETPKYKWVSSNTAVAEVNAITGEITAKKLGTATIYITMENDDDIKIDAKCELIVRDTGDVDGDGMINSSDILCIMKHCVGTEPIELDNLKYADIDNSGEINIVDALKLQSMALDS